MNNFKILLKKDLLELKRTKKWLVYITVFVFVTIFSVVSARLLPEILNSVLSDTDIVGVYQYQVSVADSYTQYIANISEIVWLLIVIMFSTTLLKEKGTGTYLTLKNNGIKEHEIVLSHFVSKLILITVSYLISVAIFVPLNLILFREYTALRGVVSLTYLYLSLVFALSLAICVSSFATRKSKAYTLVIVIYFGLSFLSVIPKIDIFNPLYGLILSSNIITIIDYKVSDYLINLLLTLIYIGGLLTLSVYQFKNKIDNRKKD